MSTRMLLALLLSGAALLLGVTTSKHGGGLNTCGCHIDHRTGDCHCHQDRGCGCECEPPRCRR